MSALPPKADIGTQSWNVRFVPKADISAQRGCCLHANSSAITFSQYVMAVTENLTPRWQTNRMKARANPKFREMAMEKNLIPAAIILLATVWFALDAGVAVLTLLS